MNTTLSILGLIATVISALGAVGAWLAARKSYQTAATLTAIELDRRHAELTPRFMVELDPRKMARTVLSIALGGPDALGQLDAVAVSIRNDTYERAEVRPGVGVPEEQAMQQIWGPLQFVHGVDGGTSDGRSVEPFVLPVGESRRLSMAPTTVPEWDQDVAGWKKSYESGPLRLTILCGKAGYAPWTVQCEVPFDKIANVRFISF